MSQETKDVGPTFTNRALALPPNDFIDFLGKHNIQPDRSVQWRIINEFISRGILIEQVRCRVAVEANDPGAKNAIYGFFATVACNLRTHQKSRCYSDRWTSNGFTQSVASEFGTSQAYVDSLVLAMREDTLSMMPTTESIRRHFLDTARLFLDHFENPPSLRPALLYILDDRWDWHSPVDFYSILNRPETGQRTRGLWTLYEIGFFQQVYSPQGLVADLTPFDRSVLQRFITYGGIIDNSLALRPGDDLTYTIHRRALLGDNPFGPNQGADFDESDE